MIKISSISPPRWVRGQLVRRGLIPPGIFAVHSPAVGGFIKFDPAVGHILCSLIHS